MYLMLQEPIQSEVIPGDTRQYNVSHKENYVYSVSVNTDTTSSGMTEDWICYYDYYKRKRMTG